MNTYTTGSQSRAAPAMEPDGDFVVVWTSYPGRQRLRRVRPAVRRLGVPRGAASSGSTPTRRATRSRPPSPSEPGRFRRRVDERRQDGSGDGIQGRRYDTHGHPPIGGEFQVNTYTTGEQFRPRIARATRWPVRRGLDERGRRRRRLRRSWPADSTRRATPVGGEFVVNTYTTRAPVFGDARHRGRRRLRRRLGGLQSTRRLRPRDLRPALRRRGRPAGRRVPGEHATRPACQRYPTVSASPAGGFVVVWTSESGDGSRACDVRPALRRRRQRDRERVRRQHVHHRHPVRLVRAGRP